jgi:hypothetical protein
MPGDRLTRSSACKNKKHADKSTTGSPKQSGIPCAMALRFPSCSPRRPGFVVSVIGAMPSIVANLTSASGYQDHTTSPFAASPLVSRQHRVHRIPRPTFVTIAKRPSYRVQDARASKGDLPDGASGIPGGVQTRFVARAKSDRIEKVRMRVCQGPGQSCQRSPPCISRLQRIVLVPSADR